MVKRLTWRAVPRPVRIGFWSLVALVVLVVAGGAIFALSFNPNSLKPRIIAAVKQETGRELTLQGPIRLGLSLQPTLVVQDVSFANPPGFSRPQMATLGELHLELALIPLLHGRVEIDQLDLVRPDIMLETDQQGRGNWQFTRPTSSPAPQSNASEPPRDKTPTKISVAEVRIEDGTVTWRDDKTGQTTAFGVGNLKASTASPDANLHLSATVTYNGTPLAVAGDVGPLARLQVATQAAPWPVRLDLQSEGATIAVDGTIAQPLEGRGYDLKLTANVPDLAALAPLLPKTELPPLKDVTLAAQVADSGNKLPAISALVLEVGPSDLTQVAGLRIDKLAISAARLDQPVRISGSGEFDHAQLSVTGSVGAPASLLAGGAPIPVDLTLQALGSNLAVKGNVARMPDGRPSLQAAVTSPMIDADALIAALRKPHVETVAASTPAAPPATPAPKPPAAKGQATAQTPLPFAALNRADADVTLTIADMKFGGANYRNIAAHIALHGGKLNAGPITAELPEGHLDATVTADTTRTPPPVSLRLQAPALAMQPLLAALGEPNYVSGNLEVLADVNGAGATPRAIAASLNGSVGLTMVNGSVDNRLLGSTLEQILRDVNVLDLVGRGGSSEVSCFATRMNFNHGVGSLRPIMLASSLITLDGGGTLNLGNDTLDLSVRAQGRVAGSGFVIPLRVRGPLRSPAVTPEPGAVVAQNAGTVAGAVLGKATPLGLLAGALGEQKLLGGAAPMSCGTALALARGQAAPAQAAQAAPASQPKPPNVDNVLKQLFR